MTNTAIQLNSCMDKFLIAHLFAKFKGRYGNLWTSRAANDDEWELIMDDWLQELKKFTLDQVRNAANKTLSIFKDYPPTLGQLVNLCIKESGVPSVKEVMQLMINRDFSHPIVKMVYEKIGGWSLANDKEENIARKAKEHYTEALAEFHVRPEKSWELLESFNDVTKSLPAPNKIPSNAERKGFKERMSYYQQKIEEEKIRCKGKTYKEFDSKKINPLHTSFDKELYEEFRKYLLSIHDKDTMILPAHYIYQRMRFIGEKEQRENLRKSGYVPHAQREDFQSTKNSDRGKSHAKSYKMWIND